MNSANRKPPVDTSTLSQFPAKITIECDNCRCSSHSSDILSSKRARVMDQSRIRSQWSVAIALPFLLSATCLAQKSENVEVSIQILTELNIAEVAIDTDSLVAWAKPAIGALETQFANEEASRTIVVQVTSHTDRQADVTVAGKPALTAAEKAIVLKTADPARSPRSKIVDCSFRIWAKVRGGAPDEKAPLEPPIETPDEHRLAQLQAAKTAEKLAIIRRWARAEALPILAAMAAKADAKFAGVRSLGKAIGDLKPDSPIDVSSLTDRNPDYWRAMMEMTPGNPLVPAVRVALHAANGEIDQARRYSDISSFFDANQSGFSRVLGEFKFMSREFYRDLESRIQQGITLHDKHKLPEALESYDAVIKDAPCSAWARYEQFHTLRTQAMEQANAALPADHTWKKTRAEILACDPLYQLMAEASGAEEMYQLVRRMQIGELFKKEGKTAADIVEYAGIAVDLEVYGFAGMLYWNAMSMTKRDQKGISDLIESYLFCLEQLGVKNIKANFNGDHPAEFAKIKARHQKMMEENPAFKAGVKPAK